MLPTSSGATNSMSVMSGSQISGDPVETPRLLPPTSPIGAHEMLLHVGVHKTGTTAIQAALADARAQLAEHGVTYPGRKQAQHGAALAVIERTWGWKERGGRPPDLARFDTLVKASRAARGRVIASSEFFCEASADQAAFVAENLGKDRLHVVITLRNLGRLLPSSWQQYLKYGLVATYGKWLTNIFQDTGKMTPSFWRRNDHASVVGRWVRCWPADPASIGAAPWGGACCLGQCASAQLRPCPASARRWTDSFTAGSAAPSMTSRAMGIRRSA